MPWPQRFLIILLPAALLCLCLSGELAPAQPHSAQQLRVFIVQSYNPEYIWTQKINEGLREGLRGLNISFQYFYMDAKRKPDPASLRQSAQDILRQIEAQAPQVVITVDDVAQIYLAQPHLKGRKSPQVIFCGVNAPLSLYGFPASNASGVRERWHFRDGFSLLKKIAPKLRSVAVISDDSESSGYVLDNLAEDQRHGPFALKLVGVEKVRTFQDWQLKVRAYQKRADALALGIFHSLVDEATGQVVPPEAVLAWTNSANRKPTLGFSDYAQDQGIMCGVLESGHEQGFLAGTMARNVLRKGVAAGTQAVRLNQKGIVFLNLKAAERFGLTVPYEIIEAAEVLAQ
jgi:ABC-type uncharacterized transport system substrate-binding protein